MKILEANHPEANHLEIISNLDIEIYIKMWYHLGSLVLDDCCGLKATEESPNILSHPQKCGKSSG